jgi:hypothetical protein
MLNYSDSLLLEVAAEFKEHMCRHSLVYAANVNILVVSRHTIKKNIESLVVASKEIGLKLMLIKVSTWSWLKIRMQNEVTI